MLRKRDFRRIRWLVDHVVNGETDDFIYETSEVSFHFSHIRCPRMFEVCFPWRNCINVRYRWTGKLQRAFLTGTIRRLERAYSKRILQDSETLGSIGFDALKGGLYRSGDLLLIIRHDVSELFRKVPKHFIQDPVPFNGDNYYIFMENSDQRHWSVHNSIEDALNSLTIEEFSRLSQRTRDWMVGSHSLQ